MLNNTTIGWSFISSGITTLFLKALPGKSLWWGIAFLIVGTAFVINRKTDTEA